MRIFPGDQAVHREGDVPGGYEQTPHKDKTAYHAADQKVQGKDGNVPAEGAAARYDPEKHPMDTEGQTAENPQQQIVHFSVTHTGGSEDEEQQHRRRDRQQAMEQERPDRFASRHWVNFSDTFL